MLWCVKLIGEIGRTNEVSAHFIEQPENLQGTAERAQAVCILSRLPGRQGAAVAVLFRHCLIDDHRRFIWSNN